MKLTYTQNGDYRISDLALKPQETPLGKYGLRVQAEEVVLKKIVFL